MLEIRTLTGIRLDIYPNATIEVNMGGISLLNLQDRTATYTNSFKLPRTPTNEAVFAFASQPTRNNRPSVDVTITKGLFQRQAVLKVLGFDKDYECSVKYNDTDIINNLNVKISSLFEEKLLDSWVTPATNQSAISRFNSIYETFTPVVYGHTANEFLSSNNSTCSKVKTIFDLFTTKYGVSFGGDLITNPDFLQTVIMIPYVYDSFDYNMPLNIFQLYQIVNATDSTITISRLIKAISHLFLVNVEFKNNTIYLNSIDLNKSPIKLDGFNFSKKTESGYSYFNYIVYKLVDESIDKLTGGDLFNSTGSGEKTILEVDNKVPKYYDTTYFGYDIYNDISSDDICLFKLTYDTYSVRVGTQPYVNVTAGLCNVLSLSPLYSNILNPIFANPVILEASRYIDPITADTIMNNRVITSVQLGGRYWVDQFAYNLTTGQSKLTLIKIP